MAARKAHNLSSSSSSSGASETPVSSATISPSFDKHSGDCPVFSGAKPPNHPVYCPPVQRPQTTERSVRRSRSRSPGRRPETTSTTTSGGSTSGGTTPGNTSGVNVARGGMTLNFYGYVTLNFQL